MLSSPAWQILHTTMDLEDCSENGGNADRSSAVAAQGSQCRLAADNGAADSVLWQRHPFFQAVGRGLDLDGAGGDAGAVAICHADGNLSLSADEVVPGERL